MRPIVVEFDLIRLIGAGAICVFPFVFIRPRWAQNGMKLNHESRHWDQQCLWFTRGLGVGLLVWWLLYLLVLPVGFNPFRARMERDALRHVGFDDRSITEQLRKAPYHLWWSQ